MSQNLRSTSKRPQRTPSDLGKQAIDLISVIDPNSLSNLNPPKSNPQSNNPYVSPQNPHTAGDRDDSTANTKKYSVHNDWPARTDYIPSQPDPKVNYNPPR